MKTGKHITERIGRMHLPATWKRPSRPAGPVTDGGKLIRMGTAVTVTAVAGFAAVQSFSHIYWLASSHGQDRVDSALLPFSVDGLILACSLVMLWCSRANLAPPFRARGGLWLGILVTVAANISYGLPHGPIGALVSAWPAVAFVIAVETLMYLVRVARDTVPGKATAPAPASTPRPFVPASAAPVLDAATEPVPEAVSATAPAPVPALASAPAPGRTPRVQSVRPPVNSSDVPGWRDTTYPDWMEAFPDDYAARRVPSIRTIRAKLGCGQKAAQEHQAHYRGLLGRGLDDEADKEGSPVMAAAS